MKLDTKALRYLTNEDWRVLTAVEIGSKNHEVVPTALIIQLSHLRSDSGVHKSISTLAKANLIARTKNAKYDGYRLTYGGLDYLSLHTHMKHGTLYSTGNCIGAGKESDIYVCAPPPSPEEKDHSSSSPSSHTRQHILKIHRLGRISFRTIKNNRDYLRHRTAASWMHMSRLAAQKEFIFMKALSEAGFAVPEAIAQNRHTIVMGLIDGVPLRSVRRLGDPAGLYAELIEMILRLVGVGLIHGDFNEFNIMIRDEDQYQDQDQEETTEQEGDTETDTKPIKPILIDFPQMLSIDHPDAETYFNRDVNCIKTFFTRRFGFTSSQPGPFFADAKRRASPAAGGKIGKTDKTGAAAGKTGAGGTVVKRLDIEAEASGFSRKMARELEGYMAEMNVSGGGGGGGGNDGLDAEDGGDLDDSEESDEDDEHSDDGVYHEHSEGEPRANGMDEGESISLKQDMTVLSIEKG